MLLTRVILTLTFFIPFYSTTLTGPVAPINSFCYATAAVAKDPTLAPFFKLPIVSDLRGAVASQCAKQGFLSFRTVGGRVLSSWWYKHVSQSTNLSILINLYALIARK